MYQSTARINPSVFDKIATKNLFENAVVGGINTVITAASQ